MKNFEILFLLFIIYSLIGWLIETTLKTIESKKFINRGFLIGPYLPIYGIGSLLMTILLKPFSKNVIILAIMSLVICSILEYITSYLMEKLFKARWWNYSNRILNINGRVCIGNSILFGLGGLIILKITNPILVNYLNNIDTRLLFWVTIILSIIFIIDLLISYIVINSFKKDVIVKLEDSTEKITTKVRDVVDSKIKEETSIISGKIKELYIQISKEIKKTYIQRPILYRRLIEAFPNFEVRKETIKKSIKKIRKKLKNNIIKK